MDIADARVRRTVNLDGRPCAEVEVATGDDRAATLLVYFAQAADGGLEMVRVIENDADREIDWYDNPLHQAAVDRTDAYLGAAADAEGSGSFGERVLNFGFVREDAMRAVRMPIEAHESGK
jgi:hypothetical protein